MGSIAQFDQVGTVERHHALPPLAVDLDGTLLRVDTLHEAVARCLLRKPWLIFLLIFQMLRGRAFLKHAVEDHCPLPVDSLPLNEPLLQYLQQQASDGREMALFSAADDRVVQRMARRLDLFSQAHGTRDGVNLKGHRKLEAIRAHFGDRFSYAGDSHADLPIWQQAETSIYVGQNASLQRKVDAMGTIEQQFPGAGSGISQICRAMRIHQWAKNFLIFVPALLSIPLLDWADLQAFAVTFLALSLVASATYLINDLLDLDADRLHPTKRHRPFASGRVSLPAGVAITLGLIGGAVGLALMLPPLTAMALAAYAAISLGYSLWLKTKPLLDVICLGFLFTLRIAIGATLLANVSPYWLYAFSMFFFISLAFVKRHTELSKVTANGGATVPGRGYQVEDKALIIAAGLGSALCSVVVFLIYLGDQHFDQSLFQDPSWLGAAAGILAYWILRIWMLALRGQMNDDPVLFALRDVTSILLGAGVVASLYLAW